MADRQYTEEDKKRVADIVGQHMDKNFVQRIADPTKDAPYIFTDGSGQTGSHLMSSASNSPDPAVDKGGFVFPQIVKDEKTGQLKKFNNWQEAAAHAKKTGEFIPFDKDADAMWFGENYKANWAPDIKTHFAPSNMPVRTPLTPTPIKVRE